MATVMYTYPGGGAGWTERSTLALPPHEGDTVHGPDGTVYSVLHVVFYPWGDPEEDEPAEPFVYVVLSRDGRVP
jgi:hypothetical protein